LEVTIRGLPDIKNPPSPLINPFNPQESLSLKFFWGLPLHVLREAEAGSPIKGGLRGAQYQHGDLYHAWKRKFGGMEARRLRENSRLKRLVADQAMQIHILKEVNAKK
jgi:putative transposase